MTVRHIIRRPLPAVAISVLLVLGAAACGDDDDDTSTASEGGGGSGEGGGDDMAVEIVSPADGDEVEGTFEIELGSNVDIGETDTGLNHFHVHYDGDAENYDIVYEEGAHTPGQELDEGEHTVQLVLANADHSETDVTDEISVTVAGTASGGGGSDSPDTTVDDPYGIGY